MTETEKVKEISELLRDYIRPGDTINDVILELSQFASSTLETNVERKEREAQEAYFASPEYAVEVKRQTEVAERAQQKMKETMARKYAAAGGRDEYNRKMNKRISQTKLINAVLAE